ncbi:TyrS-associated PheT N-terminal domain-related protein TapR [Mycoplasmopsis columboralis]|uniref:Phenylalanyl-tRNA synthetase subunit beta n=1 Tax=Mycoplasmopsis columboralis TaxID=171282 RepID=A0A449B7D1_9BACT|nr:hypothetical protein [Mycoplasmopsis columboralis]VEU76479.1 phenylalanyl-tRNA synthetase subunit beta [Mycoplasmopsis columboralis]
MIIVHKLSDKFANCAILTIDSQVKITNKISDGNWHFFVDQNNNVHSINVFDDQEILQSSTRVFSILPKFLEEKIQNKAKALDLIIKSTAKFVYAEVSQREVHPKSDKLFVLKLNLGNEEIQVVTNTLTSTVGSVLVVALPGAITASGLEIIPGKMLDVPSNGMLIGYATLGIEQEGLIFGTKEQIGKEFNF